MPNGSNSSNNSSNSKVRALPKRRAASSTSPAERQLRIDLAAAFRLVAHFGWDDLVATHISVRIPGPEHHFLLNPFGTMFHEITASSLVKIDLDGKVLEGSEIVNAAGFTIHSAIHAAREDAQCVMHLHTIAGMGVSAQECGLLPLTQSSMLMASRTAYHEYEGIAFDHDERPRLVADLGKANCMILRNHGTLTVGKSVAEAFTWMYQLERSCQAQIAAQAGGKLHLPPESAQRLVPTQVRDMDDVSRRAIWPALLRLLDERSPGYKN
jgi:ribulose-5-phosphate 4-epimerase/fuculose-1-phosphate aldolase